MNLATLDIIVGWLVASMQATAGVSVDLSIGSVLRAIFEAVGAVVLWVQSLIASLLGAMRAATATGADLDSWMADYGLTRLAATPSVVTLTFARFTPSAAALVPVGFIGQTADGSQQFAVIADPTNAAWSATQNGYVIPIGTTSVAVPAKATVAGSAGNVPAGAINALGAALVYVDTVTNVYAAAEGDDPETDAAFRARFVQYLASLEKATLAAIQYAVISLGQTLSYSFTELFDINGNARPGYFYGVIDDGSGATPSGTVSAVYAKVDAVRAFGVAFSILAATDLPINISVTLVIASGYDAPTVRAAVQAAIVAYVNGLSVGATVAYNRLVPLLFQAGVLNFSSLTLNGGTTDVVPTAAQVPRSNTISVS